MITHQNPISPQQLVAQSEVKIDRWIDWRSDEAKRIDDMRDFSAHILHLGEDGKTLTIASDGSVWGYDKERSRFWPLHFEYRGKLIGYRFAAKAAN